jgi:hypothetical protein
MECKRRTIVKDKISTKVPFKGNKTMDTDRNTYRLVSDSLSQLERECIASIMLENKER